MTQYAADRAEAYADILEDGAMGTAFVRAQGAYDPGAGKGGQQAPTPPRSVPMLETTIDRSVRYMDGTLIGATDVRLLVAAQDDQGEVFELTMGHVLAFQGRTYTPKGIDRIAPDGAAILYDIVAGNA